MLWRSAEVDLELDEGTRDLRSVGEIVPLPPKCFDLMLFLARRSERVVPRRELLAAVWPGVNVTQSSLNQVVFLLRCALGPHAVHLLRTVRGGGYQLRSFSPIRPQRSSDFEPGLQKAPELDHIQATIEHLERAAEALRLLAQSLSPDPRRAAKPRIAVQGSEAQAS